VCNQAEQVTVKAAGGEFDFCIMDIRPRQLVDVLIMSLFARVVKRGRLIVIRLPDNPLDTLPVISFLALTHTVQIFKSPFGQVKYYLFLRAKNKYPEAAVFNYLSKHTAQLQIVNQVPDELIYNLKALINYYDKKFNQDKVLTWYFKSADLLK
jgi:hypothetical protein